MEAAIEELGYVPNALARQLRSKRTKTIALVVSDISNPFFTTIARGVEDVAVGHGFSVMYCNTDESEVEEEQYLLMLIERQVDGVLLVPARSSGESFRLLTNHHMPVVVLDRRVAARNVDSVRCDSEAGAHALTRHLVELGHRRIAVLTGRRNISTSIDRVAGCRRALEEAGLLPATTSWSTAAGSTSASSTRPTATAWPRRSWPPTASARRPSSRQQLHRLRGDPGAARGGPAGPGGHVASSPSTTCPRSG